MRNYMILNGKNSNEIKGLIIQEFAPITKPQMRTQVETIDGRDGDIVTPLGYASYSKKISIGLYGDFDINEVIAYFATEGEVIFSNEPDKYYEYKIIDQVDYERLIRFRVASVTMHVQPFKYSATEGTITKDASGTVSDEGSELVLENTAESPFNVFRHKGNATQKTYTGKNLLPVANTTRTIKGVTFTPNADGSVTVNGTATDNATYFLNADASWGIYNIPLTGGKTYILNGGNSGGVLIQAGVRYIGAESASLYPIGKFTLTDDAEAYAYIRISSGTTVNNQKFYIQLEENSQVSDYEPYVGGKASPNPDYPQDIKLLSGDSKVKVVGKNLWDSDLAVEYSANSTVFITDGWLQFGTGGRRLSYPLNVPVGTSVILTATIRSLVTTQNVVGFEFLYEDGTTANLGTAQILTDTDEHDFIASGTTTKKVVCVRSRYTSARDAQLKLDTIQLELGTATAYEPYQGQEYVIPFGDTYLAGIGDYADEPVKVGDTWYIRRKVGKVVLDGTTETWRTSGSEYYTSVIQGLAIATPQTTRILGLSNYFLVHGWSYRTDDDLHFHPNGNLQVANANYATLSDWTAWLASHPTTVYYELTTPTDEEITDQNLIDALETMYEQAHAYKGRTHITASADDDKAPAIIEAEVNENNESTIVNSGNTNSKPVITIYGQGDIAVYLNGIQALQIALGDEDHITIDVEQMEAYKDSLENLKNRLVTGDYNNLSFKAGDNTIYFTGIVTKYEVENYSRWL